MLAPGPTRRLTAGRCLVESARTFGSPGFGLRSEAQQDGFNPPTIMFDALAPQTGRDLQTRADDDPPTSAGAGQGEAVFLRRSQS